MGPTWGPSGADRTQVGPMLAPWTLLSGYIPDVHKLANEWHASSLAASLLDTSRSNQWWHAWCSNGIQPKETQFTCRIFNHNTDLHMIVYCQYVIVLLQSIINLFLNIADIFVNTSMSWHGISILCHWKNETSWPTSSRGYTGHLRTQQAGRWVVLSQCSCPELILGLRPANERCRYFSLAEHKPRINPDAIITPKICAW